MVLGGGQERGESKRVGLPRRRESGAILTVWMRDPPCSNEERGEGNPWWVNIASGCLMIVEVKLV